MGLKETMQLTCLRCGWVWKCKGKGLPLTCPHCRSPYWNKPRKNRLGTGKSYYHREVK